jgi:hypothetical protein
LGKIPERDRNSPGRDGNPKRPGTGKKQGEQHLAAARHAQELRQQLDQQKLLGLIDRMRTQLKESDTVFERIETHRSFFSEEYIEFLMEAKKAQNSNLHTLQQMSFTGKSEKEIKWELNYAEKQCKAFDTNLRDCKTQLANRIKDMVDRQNPRRRVQQPQENHSDFPLRVDFG